MKILSLHSENIKKLKVIDITPTDNAIIIGGKNGNGKSSILDSICMALGGKKLIPEKPMREGETTARIDIDLGDFKVSRNWTSQETSYLKVESREGAKISNGQDVLNAIVGNLSFDPLAFSTMKPDDRLKVLKDITGLDFSKLDAEFKASYEKRRDIGRDGEKLKVRVETEFKDVGEVVELGFSVEDIKAKRNEALEFNKSIENELENIKRDDRIIADTIKVIEDHKKEIEYAEAELLNYKEQRLKRIPLAERTPQDVSVFDAKLEEYFKIKASNDKATFKSQVVDDLEHTRKAWKLLDDRLKAIEKDKSDQLKAAKMPIEGLSLGDGEVIFNGIPFAQLSKSEQIRISMSIAIAMNPKLRIAMIYDGSLLDSDAMKAISELAKEKDCQVWIERVADGPDGKMLYIEEGEIKP